jgi:D-alanyl-lipoteichoic acid acyltransferase DltB (MBOAT superfamily)
MPIAPGSTVRSGAFSGRETISSPASIEFLAWMMATTAVYWLLPPASRRYLLIISTAGILAYADPRSLLALSAISAAVCIASQVRGAWRAASLLGACAATLGVLLAFKYLDAAIGTPSILDRIIPLGLSFYTLRCIHLLLEQYLDHVDQPTVLQVIEYLFFPPTIIAGPIHRYPTFVSEKQTAFEFEKFSEGLERILYGYFKIIVVSNYLLSYRFSRWAFHGLEPSTATYQYLDALNYGLTIYLQFSGYSDIAIGFALLFGHRVMENFSWPLLQPNIVLFWRNWHISLTSFCREYVFTGVYASSRRAWAGVFATMLAISLWHGLTLNYLAWGIYHATGLMVFQQWSKSTAATYLRGKLPLPISQFLGWFLTFQFVMLGFVWTKESDIETSFNAFITLFEGVFGRV